MGKTADYYNSPAGRESYKKKKAYDKKFNAKPEQIKKRSELNKYNREKGTYGNGDNKDAAHKGGKIVGFKKASENRGSKSDSPGDRRARGKK